MSQSGSYTSGGGGGGSLNTLTGNTGGAVSPTGGNINVVGSGTISVTGNPGTSTLTISSSSGSSITYDADSGSATPSVGVLQVSGGSNINTSGATNVLTINLDNTVSISGSMTAGTGFVATTGDVAITAGNLDLPLTNVGATQGAVTVGTFPFLYTDTVGGGSVFAGFLAGNPAVGTAGGCVGLGQQALQNVNGGGSSNAVGLFALQDMTTGSQNNAVGFGSIGVVTSGNSNNALGAFSLNNLATGSFNIAIGDNAGTAYNAAESDNILIGYNLGVVGESSVIRIGATGGGHPQTSCFIAGIHGNSPSTPEMVIVNASGELGSQAIPSGSGISTLDGDTGSATGATVTIAGGSNMNTSATGSTVTVNLDSTVSISGSMTAGTGFTATTGDVTISAGNINLPGVNVAETQGILFVNGSRFLSSDLGSGSGIGVCLGQGAGNPAVDMAGSIAIGPSALSALDGSGDGGNVGIGGNVLLSLTEGFDNIAIGQNTLFNLVTGDSNICMGFEAGSNYTGAESGNIIIGTDGGTNGESNVMRLGNPLSIVSSFIGGAYGVTPSMSPQMMTIGSDGQLGSQAIPGGGGFTWTEITASTVSMAVSNGYILNNAGGVTATLPATAAVGSTMRLAGKGSGGWTLAQNSGQSIEFGAQSTTPTTGTISPQTLPNDQYAALEILCITADTLFEVISSVGNFTIS